jgi:hypothetical protein
MTPTLNGLSLNNATNWPIEPNEVANAVCEMIIARIFVWLCGVFFVTQAFQTLDGIFTSWINQEIMIS